MQFFRALAALVLISVATGASSSFFLHALWWAGEQREGNHFLIFLLPLAGLLIIWIYSKWGQGIHKGNHLIFKTIKSPNKKLPARMAPMVLVGTVFSHLFGASVGREGTAVQFGAVYADQFRLGLNQKTFLFVGMSAGFASIFGTPLAGSLFGIESARQLRQPMHVYVLCILGAFMSYYTSLVLKAPHSHYSISEWPSYSLTNGFYLILASVGFGIFARAYVLLKKKISSLTMNAYLKIFLVSGVLVIYFLASGSTSQLGLSLPIIKESFLKTQTIDVPMLKLVFTAICSGGGFLGGEVTPLFMIGSSLGSFFSGMFPLGISFLAAIGFSSVFAGAARLPLVSALMACEIFGWKIAPMVLLSCVLSSALNFGSHLYIEDD